MARLARIVVPGVAQHLPDWRAMLRHGLEAAGIGAPGEAVAAMIEARLSTGRLLGAAEWIAAHEAASGRRLTPARRGPKVRRGEMDNGS